MPTVLIVEDNTAIRTMFSRALAAMVTVEEASEGERALELLAAKHYDFVLLDLHMPGCGGARVLETLKREGGLNKDTPVCVVSADGSDAALIAAVRADAYCFLTKPVRIGAMVALVSDALRKRGGAASIMPPANRALHQL